MDRRVTLKWMLAAATLPLGRLPVGISAEPQPYGTDPRLLETYHPGDLWPLTFTEMQRRMATVLCDLIIPADERSPSASAVGVVEFIDEWISAPYPMQREDRKTVLAGLAWFDAEAASRFSSSMLSLRSEQLDMICQDICYLPRATPDLVEAARFFARYRDLTAGGFYTTTQGREDLAYVGNVPLPRFDGPPLEVLKKVGLA
jgi:hypothetical protein